MRRCSLRTSQRYSLEPRSSRRPIRFWVLSCSDRIPIPWRSTSAQRLIPTLQPEREMDQPISAMQSQHRTSSQPSPQLPQRRPKRPFRSSRQAQTPSSAAKPEAPRTRTPNASPGGRVSGNCEACTRNGPGHQSMMPPLHAARADDRLIGDLTRRYASILRLSF